jgi:uncharacterized repeat protein (TIGR01451 family)
LFVVAGSELSLDYVVSNTGNVLLSGLVVTDSLGYSCVIASLGVGASDSCSREITAQIGQQSATATVTGTPPGELASITSDPDPINYFGATLNLTMVKKTNGQLVTAPEGLYVLTGSTVNWTYELTNKGNVTLTNIRVVDDNGTPGLGDDHTVCSGITLNPGASHTCTWSQTAKAGAYSNTATATASPPSPLSEIQTTADSHYFGATLDIRLIKRTNGADAKTPTGPLIGVGEEVTWTYQITNLSNVSLTGITVTDDKLGAISCPFTSLAASDSMICSRIGEAVAGQYANLGTVSGTPPGGLDPISDTDPSHYYGVITGIAIEKLTNGFDGDSPTGPVVKVGEPVTWTYNITNTGNVDLTAVSLVDSVEGPIACPTTLAKGASMTCEKVGIAEEGQYSNLATVTANPPAGFAQVSASDPSHYYGSDAGVSITKLTNGVDVGETGRPYILVGEQVTWTYLITNIGNVQINNIKVSDSDPSLTINCESTTLAPDALMTCTALGTAIKGEYTNTGYVEATPLGFEEKVQDSDSSAYFGAEPAVAITKYTNGEDAKEPTGPYIPVGEPVTFTLEISDTETGHFDSEIEVVDDSDLAIEEAIVTGNPGETTASTTEPCGWDGRSQQHGC